MTGTIIANDQSLRFSLSSRASRARRLSFLLQGSHPFLGRPFFLSICFALRRPFFLSACFALRRTPRPPARKTHSLARTPTTDGRTTRRAVRRHG